MELLTTFLFLVPVVAVYFLIFRMQKQHVSFSKRVLTALGLAFVYGIILNVLLTNEVITGFGNLNNWLVFLGYGYVDLLRMISIPLIFISILYSINNLNDGKSLGKKALTVILVLTITAGISAAIGAGTAKSFDLNANDILGVDFSEIDCTVVLEEGHSNNLVVDACKYGTSRESKASNVKDLPTTLRSLIPSKPLYALTGNDDNSTIKTVIFAFFIGLALLAVKRKYPKEGELFSDGVNSLQKVIMRLTTIVLRLTPYGIFALMTRVAANTGIEAIKSLSIFLIASYVALTLVFVMHTIVLKVFGFSPVMYFKKAFRNLSFAFISRSSSGTLPITIETQENRFGVDDGVAAISSSFGTSIGQNGCAGVYPAMLIIMIWAATGFNPGLGDYLYLIVIVVITSFGIAGIGGGATFAAIAVVSAMGLEEYMWLTGVLYSIEALIDMYRTAANVSGSLLAGLITGKLTDSIDMDIYNKPMSEIVTSDKLVEMDL